MGEDGILELCELLTERGIGREAGLLSLRDARIFVESGIASRYVRAMIAPLTSDPDEVVALAAEIEQTLAEGAFGLSKCIIATVSPLGPLIGVPLREVIASEQAWRKRRFFLTDG